MNIVNINLYFKKEDTHIVGYEYGIKTYAEQAKSKFILGEKVKFVFPQHIIKISSTFVQGFFSNIIENIGYSGVRDSVFIEAESKKLKDNIWDKIFS